MLLGKRGLRGREAKKINSCVPVSSPEKDKVGR